MLSLRLLTAAVALLVLATGLWPEPLLSVSGRAAEALTAGSPG
jgi:multicomponent Na+:H+ antiporter subunit D